MLRAFVKRGQSARVRAVIAAALGVVGAACPSRSPGIDAASRDAAAGVAQSAAIFAAGQLRAPAATDLRRIEAGGPSVFSGSNAYRAFAAAPRFYVSGG